MRTFLVIIDESEEATAALRYAARRAAAVQNFLISQGVPANRLRTISYGKERPVALASNESAWAQNRRAASVIIN